MSDHKVTLVMNGLILHSKNLNYNYLHLGHCFSLLVKGTYMTPIRLDFSTVPSSFLSTCCSIWLWPSGPTGQMRRPPGFSCSTSWKINKLLQSIFSRKTIFYNFIYFFIFVSLKKGTGLFCLFSCVPGNHGHARAS